MHQEVGYEIRDQIETMQSQLEGKSDKLRAVVMPLSELEDREVSTLEVKEVQSEELAILKDLEAMADALVPIDKRIADLDA